MSEDNRRETEKLARTVNDYGGPAIKLQLAAASIEAYFVVGFVILLGLFLIYVAIMPPPSGSGKNRTPPLNPPGHYSTTREITREEFPRYWNDFCDEAARQGNPAWRWRHGKWEDKADVDQCRQMFFAYLAQRGLRMPPPGSDVYR